MAKSFIKGALVLTICGFIGKLIGAFYRIPFALIVGAEGVGLYQLVYPLYTLMLTLSSSGLPSSISKILSEQFANGEYNLAKKTFKFSMLLIVTFSIIGSLLIVAFSWPLAELQGNPSAFGCYLAISPAVFFVGIISGLRGFFQAKENMVPTAVSGLIEQACKVIFGLLIAKLLIPKGIIYATIGALIGVTISEIFACLYMVITLIFTKKKFTPFVLMRVPIRLSNKQILRKILSIALPIAIGGLIMPISLLIDSTLIVKILSSSMGVAKATTLFGLQSGIVGSLSNLPAVASIGVATAILPKISKEKAHNNDENVKLAIKNALAFVMFVAVPCAICFYVFSGQIINFLYGKTFSGEEIEVCIRLLKFGCLNIITLSLAQVSAGILQGLGKVKVPVYSLLVGAVVKVISLVILVRIPSVNIYGAELSDALCFGVAAIINIFIIYRNSKFNIAFDMLQVGALSAIIALVAFGSNSIFEPRMSVTWSLVLAGGITAMLYLSLLGLILIKKQKNLRNKLNYNRSNKK